MEKNTCLVYSGVTEGYQKLLQYCRTNGFKVKETDEKFFHIKGKKSYLFFWRNLNLEIEIQGVGKTQAEIKIIINKLGKRQPKLEDEYITAIEGLF